MALPGKSRRKNFLGFGKKVTHSTRLLSDAYDAGRKTGDTKQFSSWWNRQSHGGLTPHGSLKRKAEKKYRAGVESLWQEEKREQQKAAKIVERKEKEQVGEVQQEVIDALVGLKMARQQATRLTKAKYHSGDDFNVLFRRVMQKNPKLAARLRKANPKKFDECVGKVSKSLKKAGRPGNAYAICTAAGTRKSVKKANVARPNDAKGGLVAKLRHGDFNAKVLRRGFVGPTRKYVVEISRGDSFPETKEFKTSDAAVAYARLRLFDIASNPDPGVDLIPGGSTLDAYVKAGHRVVKGVTKAAKTSFHKAKKLVLGKKNPLTPEQTKLYRAAEAADAAFQKALVRTYGKRAGDVRYRTSQQSSVVRELGRQYQTAMEAYHKSRGNPKRKNPLDLAQQRHEEFTGFPSTETLELTQRQHVHTALTGLGQFVAFNLMGVDGRELPPMISAGMKYQGPPEEILVSFKGKPKGDWYFDPKTPAKDIVWLTASEQTERDGKEMKQQLYLSGGDQKLSEKDLGYFRIEPRDIHDNTLIGTIVRIWYLTKKVFEADGKEKVWFFHDLGKEGSGGICPVLIYHPLDPSFEIAGGRYYIAPPRRDIKASPGIVG